MARSRAECSCSITPGYQVLNESGARRIGNINSANVPDMTQ